MSENGNGLSKGWALGVAGTIIALLLGLVASTQLRRLDEMERRVNALESRLSRLEAMRMPPYP